MQGDSVKKPFCRAQARHLKRNPPRCLSKNGTAARRWMCREKPRGAAHLAGKRKTLEKCLRGDRSRLSTRQRLRMQVSEPDDEAMHEAFVVPFDDQPRCSRSSHSVYQLGVAVAVIEAVDRPETQRPAERKGVKKDAEATPGDASSSLLNYRSGAPTTGSRPAVRYCSRRGLQRKSDLILAGCPRRSVKND